jgi:protein gp37
MNQDNLIQWPRAKYWDKAWNPVVGCKPCSPACENCYAAAWAKRFGQSFEPHKSSQTRPPRSGIVFCGNMTDLFGLWCDGVEIDNSIEYIGATLGYHDKATYLWLTKRAGYMCHTLRTGQVFLKDDNAADGIDIFSLRDVELCNQYFGFTAENQCCWDTRIGEADFPEGIKWWVSCEPLLGPIDLWLHAKTVFADGHIAENNKPSWVVVGCESGPNRRPCKIEWVESIVDQCRSAGVPVFVKQLDIGGKCEHDIDKFPAHLRIRQVPWA